MVSDNDRYINLEEFICVKEFYVNVHNTILIGRKFKVRGNNVLNLYENGYHIAHATKNELNNHFMKISEYRNSKIEEIIQ